jgi:hypothetical protein
MSELPAIGEKIRIWFQGDIIEVTVIGFEDGVVVVR